MSEPRVSISIASYNQAAFIHETLTSALEQDYDNLQVVISDDGSRDGTADIIRDYAARYPQRLVAITEPTNVGITRNNNRILPHCDGKYIAFQGGDDVLLAGKIRAQVNWMEADERRAMCGHDVEVFDSDSGVTQHLWSAQIPLRTGASPYDAVVFGHLFAGTSTMIRAKDMPRNGFDVRVTALSDWKFWIDVLTHAWQAAPDHAQFGWIEGVYARYRIWAGNTMKKKLRVQKDMQMCARLLMNESPDPRIRQFYQQERAKRDFERGYYFLRNGDSARARYLLSRSVHTRIYARKPVIAYLASLLPAPIALRMVGAYRAQR